MLEGEKYSKFPSLSVIQRANVHKTEDAGGGGECHLGEKVTGGTSFEPTIVIGFGKRKK